MSEPTGSEGDLRGHGLLKGFFGDHPGSSHVAKDIVLPIQGFTHGPGPVLLVPLDHRVVPIGTLHRPGNEGALHEVEFVDLLVEEVTGCNGDAPAVPANEELIGVELEDLVLGVVGLEAQGVDELHELGPEGALVPGKEVLRRLLAQRAPPLDDPARLDVLYGRPGDGAQVEAGVAVEVPVLGRDQGIDEGPGDLGEGDIPTVLFMEEDTHQALPVRIKDRGLRGEEAAKMLPADLLARIVGDEVPVGQGQTGRSEQSEEQHRNRDPYQAAPTLFSSHFKPTPLVISTAHSMSFRPQGEIFPSLRIYRVQQMPSNVTTIENIVDT